MTVDDNDPEDIGNKLKEKDLLNVLKAGKQLLDVLEQLNPSATTKNNKTDQPGQKR